MSEMSLSQVLKDLYATNHNVCKVGLWYEKQSTQLIDEIAENINNGVPVLTVYRALKLMTQVPFSDKTWQRHLKGNCQC